MADEKRDFRKDLADKIVELMEKGTAPWQKPWNPAEPGCLQDIPHNAVTGRPYRGGNSFWLMISSGLQGYDDPRWCTYKQAQSQDWQVRKGEKSSIVEYWQFEEEKKQKNPVTGKMETKKFVLEKPRIFYASVFNAKQIDGIPAYESAKELKPEWSSIAQAEQILKNSGAKIFHNQSDSAYYSPSSDSIHLPPKTSFPTAPDYYATALHELGHWTGHKSRLNRDLSGKFHSEAYAKEELRAEMASLYLSVELGIPFNPESHAAYNGFWVKFVKEDKHEFFRAARDAGNITDYVLDLSKKKEIHQETVQKEPDLKIVEAVADKVVLENIKNPELAQQVMTRIQAGFQQKFQENKVHEVLIYDKNVKASSKKQGDIYKHNEKVSEQVR